MSKTLPTVKIDISTLYNKKPSNFEYLLLLLIISLDNLNFLHYRKLELQKNVYLRGFFLRFGLLGFIRCDKVPTSMSSDFKSFVCNEGAHFNYISFYSARRNGLVGRYQSNNSDFDVNYFLGETQLN